MNKSTKIFLKKLIKKYPNIVSGRKNFDNQYLRIKKTINIISKYYKKTSN